MVKRASKLEVHLWVGLHRDCGFDARSQHSFALRQDLVARLHVLVEDVSQEENGQGQKRSHGVASGLERQDRREERIARGAEEE